MNSYIYEKKENEGFVKPLRNTHDEQPRKGTVTHFTTITCTSVLDSPKNNDDVMNVPRVITKKRHRGATKTGL